MPPHSETFFTFGEDADEYEAKVGGNFKCTHQSSTYQGTFNEMEI